jgi:enoyl-CoA hydratase
MVGRHSMTNRYAVPAKIAKYVVDSEDNRKREPTLIRLEQHGPCAVVYLDRPQAMNALDAGAMTELETVLARLATGDARALIVTGAGERAFSAGADVAELGERDAEAVRAASRRGQALGLAIEALPMPSIALLNGYALGGALELALCCTFRLATPQATLGFPEIKLGVSTGWGGTQRLPRLIRTQDALDLLMSGRMIDAQEAVRLGVAHAIVDGLEGALEFARRFTANSLVAMAFVRQAVCGARDTSLEWGLEVETDISVQSYATEDATEGIAAFLAKRPPVFHDR